MGQRNERSLRRKLGLGGVLGLATVGLAACDVEPPAAASNFLHMGWPEGVTPEANSMFNFWIWIWVLAWFIGIIMWALFLTAIFRWSAKRAKKKGRGEFPRQLQYNVPVELVLTIIPVIIVMALFFFTVQVQQKVVANDKEPEVAVDVTAFQWNWKFGYAEVGGNFTPNGQDYDGEDEERTAIAEKSQHDPEDMKNANPVHGRSSGDNSYLNYNEIETLGTTDEIPVLVLPTNTAIEFRLASGDVSHSFWVPEFLFKRDVYSHPENNQQERAFQIEEIQEEGAFVGRCAEMCGTYHAMMNFEIRAVSPEKFADYMEFRLANPDAPNSEALASIGEAPYATSTKPFNSARETADGDNVADPNTAL